MAFQTHTHVNMWMLTAWDRNHFGVFDQQTKRDITREI